MAEAQIPCTYTLKDTKKESNWSYEDGALHVKNRLAILRDENGSKIGESLVLTAAQKTALDALGWCGGERTCDDELKLKFRVRSQVGRWKRAVPESMVHPQRDRGKRVFFLSQLPLSRLVFSLLLSLSPSSISLSFAVFQLSLPISVLF